MAEIRVCGTNELSDGKVRVIEMPSMEIGVIRHAGQYFAYQNKCPHRGGPACEGIRLPKVVDVIEADGTFTGQSFDESEMHIVCPWHGWEFRLSDGVCSADRKWRLKKFEVVERAGDIFVVI